MNNKINKAIIRNESRDELRHSLPITQVKIPMPNVKKPKKEEAMGKLNGKSK